MRWIPRAVHIIAFARPEVRLQEDRWVPLSSSWTWDALATRSVDPPGRAKPAHICATPRADGSQDSDSAGGLPTMAAWSSWARSIFHGQSEHERLVREAPTCRQRNCSSPTWR